MAKEGNFAVRLLKDEDNKVVDQGLKLIDAQGLLLRDAGNSPETIETELPGSLVCLTISSFCSGVQRLRR